MTHKLITGLDVRLMELAQQCWPYAAIEIEIDEDTFSVFDVLPNGNVRQTLLLIDFSQGGDVKPAAYKCLLALSSK